MDKKEISSLKKFFMSLVNIMQKNNNYADALLIKESSLVIVKDNKEINIDRDSDIGVKLRLFDGEKFHEFGCSGIDKQMLVEKAKSFGSIPNKKKVTVKQSRLNKDFLQKGKINPESVDIKHKVEFISQLQKSLGSADKRIINAKVLYGEEKEFKLFVNKYRQLSQEINSCHAALVPFIITPKGEIRYNYKSFLKAGYEVTRIDKKEFNEFIEQTLKIADAEKIMPGKYTCILSPDVAGLLAHESFGHGMESDTLYKERAKAKEYIGKRIANPYVSILDNPAYPKKNGSFYFDDEGELAKATYLIKNGIVSCPITDYYSSSLLGIKRTANARAESYDHKAYARMSNTYFAQGKIPLQKILAKVKNGLYLHHSSGGMEDPKGWHVQIQGIVGEEIKDGRLTGRYFYEIGMTGYLPTILGNITAVSSQFSVPGVGHCGKGHKEWVRVSEGGSHLLIKDVDLS